MSNLADLVRDAAAARPGHPALVTATEEVSWRSLDERVERAAREFALAVPERGARVALLMTNRIEFVVAYFGVLRAGLVAMPINPGYTVREISALLEHSGARLLVHEPAAAQPAALAADFPAVRFIALDSEAGQALAGMARARQGVSLPANTPGRALALLMYTTGGHAGPRGAMLTHGALRANIESLARLRNPAAVMAEDRVLLVLPIFHIFGLNSGLGLAARKAATCVLMERFGTAESALAVIRDQGVSMVAGAPPMYQALVSSPDAPADLARVRLLISGASPLSPDLFTEFAERIGKPLWEGYGLTECAPVVTSSLVSGEPKAGAVGRPVSGVEVSLRGRDGLPVEAGDPGELWVRGQSVFSGYWPDGRGGANADGWYDTGDVALTDEDGDYHLVDRRDDLIIVSGFNVYPREVEEVLGTHPDVADVAAVGVSNPQTGEAVRAIVALRAGAPEPTDLREYCMARLARFKCPASIQFVAQLPRTPGGALDRAALREQWA